MNKFIRTGLLCALFSVIVSSSFSVSNSMWVWFYKETFDSTKRQEMLDLCKSKNIQTIFLQVPYEPVTTKNGELTGILNSTQQLRESIIDAHKRGIKVEALDGAPKWAFKKMHPYVLGEVDAVLEFNKQGKKNERFDGIQYDIEPHSLPEFKNGNQVSGCKQYLELISAIKDKIKSSGQKFTLGLAIPMWYDKNKDDNGKLLYEFSWKNKVKTMDQHLLDLVDEIAIMDYRTQAGGSDGAIPNAKGEIQYADSINKKVWVGLETSEQHDDPPWISFFGQSETDYDNVAGQINVAFQKNPSYQGIAIHYYESYKDLLRNTKHK